MEIYYLLYSIRNLKR